MREGSRAVETGGTDLEENVCYLGLTPKQTPKHALESGEIPPIFLKMNANDTPGEISGFSRTLSSVK